jgi:hypothetical protein
MSDSVRINYCWSSPAESFLILGSAGLLSIFLSHNSVRVRVTLRLAVYRLSVRLGANPMRPTTRIFFQLNTCGYSPYVTSSLMRGWVCRLQLLLALASAVIFGSESRGTRDHILLSQVRDSPIWRARSPYLYLQEQGGPVIPPGTGFPFRRLSRLAGLWRRYLNPPPHGVLRVTPFF